MAKFLILFGALSNSPASYADRSTKLNGELAQLYDVA